MSFGVKSRLTRSNAAHVLAYRKVAQDNEFALYTVTIFRRVRDEFAQKCRDEKFTVREYVYDEAAVEKQNQELAELESSEKELWVRNTILYPIAF